MAEQRIHAPARIAFADGTLSRAAQLRANDDDKALPRRESSCVILVGTDQNVAVVGEETLARLRVTDLPAGTPLTFLGLEPASGAAVFAADALDLHAAPAHAFASLRELMADLDPADAALGAYAAGMVGWHRVHRHCGRCGATTTIEQAGHRRHCPSCGLIHFPRTDPAVTMLVQTGDRALLSRRHGAAAHRWSALAGFVEPGETPEQAVVREALEETGIHIAAVEYVTSQPWPFPSALMLAFWAFADPGANETPTPEAGELEEAHWFDRAELGTKLAEGSIGLPPPGTIGNYLISTWLSGG